MTEQTHADALVFFGATGDLAYKQIFPALQALVTRHHLTIPIVGVAKSGWNLEQLTARARESLAQHGLVDETAFAQLRSLLHYVDGDYSDPATYTQLRQELGDATRPLHYLAIPPSMFGTIAEGLARVGCTTGARVVVEKPFGRDLASARHLNQILHQFLRKQQFFASTTFSAKSPCRTSSIPVLPMPCSNQFGTVPAFAACK